MPLNPSQLGLSGPIPGESLTRAPGDAPWEKPPQYAQIDDAMNFIMKQFSDRAHCHGLLAVLEAGAPMDVIVSTILKHGFAEGKWTPSLAALLAKPLALLLHKLATQAGVKYIPSYKNPKNDLNQLLAMVESKKHKEKVTAEQVKKFQAAIKSGVSPGKAADQEPDEDDMGGPSDNDADNAPSNIPQGGLMSPTMNKLTG